MSIEDNLNTVREKMASACKKAGRSVKDVRLVAVSKTKPPSMIEEAMRARQNLFGENYIQESLLKSAEFPSAEWHLIGSVQTNKVKLIVGKFALIHSVDRLRLVTELARAAEVKNVVQEILLQVHVGDEETKQGVSFTDAPNVIDAINEMPSLKLRGLMALPPLTENESQARAAFASVREAFEKWQSLVDGDAFSELSMGTSGDYEWAILEGATLVRVGTSIFGARDL